MKWMTIVPEDNTVVVDGEAIQVEVSIDPEIHAIQWDEDNQVGEIEYEDSSGKGNVKIGPSEMKTFLPLVDAHESKKKEVIKAQEVIDAELKNHQDLIDKKYPPGSYYAKRHEVFQKELKVGDQLDEILKFVAKQGGKTPEMDVILAKSKEIKDRFPKEGE